MGSVHTLFVLKITKLITYTIKKNPVIPGGVWQLFPVYSLTHVQVYTPGKIGLSAQLEPFRHGFNAHPRATTSD